jgi:nitrite reductase (NADH) large subunit
VDKKNVTTLRSIQDADFILKACRTGANVVCIGGGILGLENAGGLARRGVHVTVVEDQPWLLSRQLNQKAAMIFEGYLRALGIIARTSVKTQELVGGDTVNGVLLNTGEKLPADVVVISTGVRSNVAIARAAGLNVNQGILVDDSMRTSHPDIFAAGDAAERMGSVYGTWNPALAEGMTAGSNAGGGKVTFTGLPRSNVLKVLGISLYSIGPTAPGDPSDILVEEQSDGYYTSFIFRGNLLIGSILLGDASLSGKVKKAIEDKVDLTKLVKRKPDAKLIKEYLANLYL